MGYIGQQVFTGVITSSDSIDAGVIEVSDLSVSAQDQLGKIDFYGFKKTNGSGNQAEDLILTYGNGTDAVSVETAARQDAFDESFFAKKGLTFSINNNGELEVDI
jgi:hypothetical protein